MSEEVKTKKKLIAVCGKGGTGKSAISAMIVKVLMESVNKPRMLLIDADPATGLAMALGVNVRRTMGQIREELIRTAQRGNQEEEVQIADALDFMVLEALQEADSFALLAMGRTETIGCFCSVNDLLRDMIETLTRSFEITIIDGEAGLEQINRQVINSVDMLIVISDATTRGLQTAALIRKMVEEERVISCRKLGLVFNRVQGDEVLLKRYAQDISMEVFGYIPQDENIVNYDLMGQSITNLPDESPALVAVRRIVEKVMN